MTPATSLNNLIERLYQMGGGLPAPKSFGRFVLVAEAGAAGVVLRNPDVFQKDYGVMELFGKSRFNANGDDWKIRRDLTQAQYNSAAGGANRDRIVKVFEEALDDVERRKPEPEQDFGPLLARSMLKAATRVFFNALEADHDTEALVDGFDRIRSLITVMQTVGFCASHSLDVSGVQHGAARVRSETEHYAADHPEVARLLKRLEAGYAGNGKFAAGDELLMNFFAGIETSSLTVAWALAQLGAYPEVQEAIREEARQPGDRPMLDTFINETLRSFPPIPLITRNAVTDFASEELTVAAGTQVLVSIIGVHRDPDQWREPTRFDPQRAEFRKKTYNRRAFLPFLLGPRVCGGAALARIEIAEGIAAALRRYRFTRTQAPIRFHYALALRPILKDVLIVSRL